jgi:hypothetical protein
MTGVTAQDAITLATHAAVRADIMAFNDFLQQLAQAAG